MNTESTSNGIFPAPRKQTLGEEIANAVSHGAGALLAIAGTIVLFIRAAPFNSTIMTVCAALYGGSMIILYTASTLYHALNDPGTKKLFRVFDHCSIFLLILGTYIPISLLLVGGTLGWVVVLLNTACAVLGIVLNSINLTKWHKKSVVLYVIMGWMVVLTIKPVWQAVSLQGLLLLIGGGVAYTVGIIFYKSREIRNMHFIWHLFVLAGSILHYLFVLYYCYPV